MKPIAFTTNPRRMGYRELYRVAGGRFVGFLACALKLFRILGPQRDGFGLRSFGDHLELRDIDSLPRHVLSEMEDFRDDLESLGFIPCFAYSLESYGSQEAHGMPHRHKTGIAAASIAYARCVRDGNEVMTTVFAFNTPMADGTYLVTSGSKKLLTKPSHFLVENMPTASPQQVFDRHLERLENTSVLPRTIKTDDELVRLVLDCENEETEFNVERGVYVRMTRDDIELGEDLQAEYQDEMAGGRRRRRRDDDEELDEEDDDDDDDDEDDERPRRRRR